VSPRAVEFEDDDGAAPWLGGGARCYTVNRLVDRRTNRECDGAIPQVQRETKGLAIEALRQDNAVRLFAREVLFDNWERAEALRWRLRRLAVDSYDSRSFWSPQRWKEIG